MAKIVAVPKLGRALLGLLQLNPTSGYALRKIFSSTAMNTYSDSPGAIYPALHRLEQRRLIRGRIESGAGLRRRRVFCVTPSGLAELKRWIARPVGRADVVRGVDELMLRFAFSEPVVGPAATLLILRSLRRELAAYIPDLRVQLMGGGKPMPTSGRLALQHGIMSYECLLQWTRQAIVTYERKGKTQKAEGSTKK